MTDKEFKEYWDAFSKDMDKFVKQLKKERREDKKAQNEG